MEQSLAPVALFVYNRPEHTRTTLEALKANHGASQTDLIVFCDAARSTADEGNVAEVRRLVKQANGFRSVEVVERAKNLGLANSIIGGVSDVLSRYERVIVMEDDLLTSPHFLRYMNDGLTYYAKDERVASIHGYTYPVRRELPESFFLRGADCWGWACWQRSWRLFEANGQALLDELQRHGLTKRFDLDGAYGFTQMLKDQIRGANNSWAVRWHASAFLAGKLTLYPGRSLVYNTGNEQSGTHGIDTKVYDVELSGAPIQVGGIPVEESMDARNAFISFMRQTSGWRNPRRIVAGVLRRLTRRA